MLSETNKTTDRQRSERQGDIMKVTKRDAMEYAKENCIDLEGERVVDTVWDKENEILRVITISRKRHLVYKLVIAYDNINEEYYKLDVSSGYMFTM